MQEVPHSGTGTNITITVSGYELLFRSLTFMLQNDYGFEVA